MLGLPWIRSGAAARKHAFVQADCGQLRLHAPATPLPATPAPAERPGNGTEVSPDLSADSG